MNMVRAGVVAPPADSPHCSAYDLSAIESSGDQCQADACVGDDLTVDLVLDGVEQGLEGADAARWQEAWKPEAELDGTVGSGHAAARAAEHAQKPVVIAEVVVDGAELLLSGGMRVDYALTSLFIADPARPPDVRSTGPAASADSGERCLRLAG
jgi:hypothetical protein